MASRRHFLDHSPCCTAQQWLWSLLCVVCFSVVIVSPVDGYEPKPVALVRPQPGKSKLTLVQEGLDLLASITHPVAPIVVIGPYRSGKSFMLNQLLGVPCGQGFGVGHTRNTETKGVWLWGEPRPKTEADGSTSMLLYIDTEGFESTGRANSYDDRIFALSTILSSLLISTLPETIRESDIAKLSFAVELAGGFYERYEREEAGGADDSDDKLHGRSGGKLSASQPGALDPGSMMWLIQRDFLQGKSADQLVQEVLSPVPNPNHDKEIANLNAIRTSLGAIARNSTGYALRQAHLERTRLCEIPDSELDQRYVQQRDKLKQLVQELARPKVIGGRKLTGKQLSVLVSKVVEVLNSQDIPNVASMIEAFNRDVVARALAQYVTHMSAVQLPVDEAVLEKADAEARGAALEALQGSLLGRSRPGMDLGESLGQQLDREYGVITTRNLAASNLLCSELENKCELELDSLQNMKVPSLYKFEAAYQKCERKFKERCQGPGLASHEERLSRAWTRASKSFSKDYNDRLFTGLVVLSLLVVVFFRFIVRVQLLEVVGWLGFVFLEVYPHLYTGNMYETRGWDVTVHVWETAILLLFGFPGSGLVWCCTLAGLLGWRLHRRRLQQRKKKLRSSDSQLKDLDV